MIATRDAYGETLARLGEINKDIVVLDADLSGSTKTAVFAKKFPDRFFNMGVAEQDMMGTAAGLAVAGKIPFASTFAIFATGRAWEQVRQSIAYPKVNVKIVASHAGITVGEDGASHQSVEDIAVMRVIPEMTVIVPADGIETRKVIEEMVRYKGPVYVRVSRGKSPVILDESYSFEIGKGTVLREGTTVAIIACGIMVSKAIEAADILGKEGLSARVINISTIKPIDKDRWVEGNRIRFGSSTSFLTVKPLPLFDEEGRKSPDGNVTCATCHNPHQWDPNVVKEGPGKDVEGDGTNSFLRVANNPDSALCRNCHLQRSVVFSKHNIGISAPEEKNGPGSKVSETGPCSACHLPHNGNGMKMWARKLGGGMEDPISQLCKNCHSKGSLAERRRWGTIPIL